MLMVFSVGVDAKIKVDLGGEKNDGVYPGGTIVEKNQTEPNANGLVTVTITVTPKKGFTIKLTDLVVVSTYSPDGSDTRSPKIAAELTLLGTDPKDLGAPRDYTFIVGSSLGAWVKEANFHSDDAKGGNRDVTTITSLEGLNAMTATGNYVITTDFSASGYTANITDFSGTLTAQAKEDGTFPVISGLRKPLFKSMNNGTVSNIMMKGVDINISDHAGAIVGTAKGTSVIYNCGVLPTTIEKDAEGNITGFTGSSIGSTEQKEVGSIAGVLQGSARVINCFSYATITGGKNVAGIVGYTGTAITQENVSSVPMIMNCMFYGEITGGTYIRPVYGGKSINNDATTGVNPYCYFRANASFDDSYTNISNFNRSWPAEEEYLTRFEYYRSILNSNKRLCTYWITGKAYGSENAPTETDEALIAKWVLDPSMAPYPVLKKWGKYPSIINPDPNRTWDPEAMNGVGNWQTRSSADPYRGKSYTQKLSVTVNPGGHAASGVTAKDLSLTITEMDTLNHDYGYYKVQLPYYNEVFGDPTADPSTQWDKRYGGNYKNYVVTGWKITSIPGGVTGVTNLTGTDANGVAFDHTFTANWESGYNFADRYCTDKDKYSVSERVFAQGGFFYVPEGVTSITIEAYWGKAVYLHNTGHYIDRVNITNQTANGNLKLGDPFVPAGTLPTTFQSQTVYDSWKTAVTALEAATNTNGVLNKTVYDQAIVLLSNLQWRNENSTIGTDIDSKWHPYTFMSIDYDLDNEPDYCFEFQYRNQWERKGIQPIRFDFLPVPELGLAVRHSTQQNTIGIFVPQGHFEITETSFMHTTQFEYDAAVSGTGACGTKIPAPIILNGGHFEQIVVRYGPQNTTQYFLMGGHFRMLRFTPGAHTNTSQSAKVRLCTVNCIGGEYPEFYLSGIYRPDITPTSIAKQGNPHCYTNGGRFDMMAGAGYDKILGGITFKIDHSIIKEFYGGGINGAKPVDGSIDVTIDHSLVGKYCGGPKVGVMSNGKTVTTHATGTTFTRFYGGGNGGTSYYRWQRQDGNTALPASTATGWANYGYKTFNPLNSQLNGNKQYRGPDDTELGNVGYNALFEFECFVESNGLGANPTVRSYMHWAQFGTTSTGTITNVLSDCTLEGDFYGGGNLGNVTGSVTSTLTDCTIKGNAFGGGFSGKIEPFRIHDRTLTEFPYIDNAGVMQNANGVFQYVKNTDGSDRYYTWCYKNASGQIFPEGVVFPSTAPTTDNPTFEYPAGSNKWYVLTTVSLEGLGAVSDYTKLTLNGTTVGTLENGKAKEGTGNVYGGGNESSVNGDTTVTLKGETKVLGDVFGGGNKAIVGGSAKVNIEN